MTPMEQLYKKHGSALERAWYDALYHTSDAPYFPTGENASRFANPIAYHMDKAAHEGVLWLLAEEGASDPIPESIDDLCRVKAVQDLTEEVALGPIYSLRELKVAHLDSAYDTKEQAALVDERLETLMGHVQECYRASKEKIQRIRAEEVERQDALKDRRARKEEASQNTLGTSSSL